MADIRGTGRLARADALAQFSRALRTLANDATILRGELDRQETDLPEAHDRLRLILQAATEAIGTASVQRLRADELKAQGRGRS